MALDSEIVNEQNKLMKNQVVILHRQLDEKDD
jgi:hypothetical protein